MKVTNIEESVCTEKAREISSYALNKCQRFLSPNSIATAFGKFFQSDDTRNCEFRERNRITVNAHIIVNDIECVCNQRVLPTKNVNGPYILHNKISVNY
jgi:hypothetical protein